MHRRSFLASSGALASAHLKFFDQALNNGRDIAPRGGDVPLADAATRPRARPGRP